MLAAHYKDIVHKHNSVSVADTQPEISHVLRKNNREYQSIGDYFLTGEIEWTQGWIFSLSVSWTQLASGLEKVLTVIEGKNIALKVVQNYEIARMILNGQHGYDHLGKVMLLYPGNGVDLTKFAQLLAGEMKHFRGPRIVTDYQLSGVLHVRYGAGVPVVKRDEYDINQDYIYDINGQLVKDQFNIPFLMPKGILWPFDNIFSYIPQKLTTTFKDKYKSISILKEDAKGNVTKALSLRGMKLGWCVIKEGKIGMSVDSYGRDMTDRIEWQYTLHKKLQEKLPIPKVFDKFYINENAYIVLQYLSGTDLDKIITSHFENNSWYSLDLTIKNELINYGITIASLIETMHRIGFIHRDITPANFLIDRNKQVWMVDLELSYFLDVKNIMPPFRLGTIGFISEEQQMSRLPSSEQDVYGLGGTFITILTGILPIKFCLNDPAILASQLEFLIGEKSISEILTKSVSRDPFQRPTVTEMKEALIRLKNALPLKTADSNHARYQTEPLHDFISAAIRGLCDPALLTKENLWHSRRDSSRSDNDYYQAEAFEIYPYFREGISGILYVLSRAKKLGFSISSCHDPIQSGIEYLSSYLADNLETLSSGFYRGTAGISIALCECIDNGLITVSNDLREGIYLLLSSNSVAGNGLIKGNAGRGMALLRARHLLDDSIFHEKLSETLESILVMQEQDGSWITLKRSGERVKSASLGHGVSGILLFLLAYLKINDTDTRVRNSVQLGMEWLLSQRIGRKRSLFWPFRGKSNIAGNDLLNGTLGIVLLLVKAYEVFRDENYKDKTRSLLARNSAEWNARDTTHETGLVGLGEVLIEARDILELPEINEDIIKISSFLTHHYREDNAGQIYWLADPVLTPTASLLTGNSGLLHFLLRQYSSRSLSHPFLIN